MNSLSTEVVLEYFPNNLNNQETSLVDRQFIVKNFSVMK